MLYLWSNADVVLCYITPSFKFSVWIPWGWHQDTETCSSSERPTFKCVHFLQININQNARNEYFQNTCRMIFFDAAISYNLWKGWKWLWIIIFFQNWYLLVATRQVTYIYHMCFCATLKFFYFVDSDMWIRKKTTTNTHIYRMSCVSIVQNCVHELATLLPFKFIACLVI